MDKKIYSLPFKVTLDTKLRAFQYRFLNRIVYTNDKLSAFKIVDYPYCTFCKNEVDLPRAFIFLLQSSRYVLERGFIVDSPL